MTRRLPEIFCMLGLAAMLVLGNGVASKRDVAFVAIAVVVLVMWHADVKS